MSVINCITPRGKIILAVFFAVLALSMVAFFAGSHFAFAHTVNTLNLTNGAIFNKPNISVTMDHPFGLGGIKYILDGRDVTSLVQYENGRGTLNLNNLSEGPHRLFVGFPGSYNPYSLVSDSIVVNFDVDLTPPELKLNYPDGELVNSLEVALKGETEQNSSVEVKINETVLYDEADGEGKFHITVPIAREVNLLSTSVFDKAGNRT